MRKQYFQSNETGLPNQEFAQPYVNTSHQMSLSLAEPATVLFSNPLVVESFDTLFRDAGTALQYTLVFVVAAVPWLELWTVIPLGIAVGMHPVGVAVFGFLGNLLSIYAVILLFARIKHWVDARRPPTEDASSKRRQRAKRLVDQYGVPGVAVGSPFLFGVHIAAFLVIALGASKRVATVWMTVSVVFWTIALTVGSYYGVEAIRAVLSAPVH